MALAWLLTYPQERVARPLQQQLAAHATIVYAPLRELVPTELTAAQRAQLAASTALVLTSHFGVTTYLAKWARVNTTATIYVLSAKMAEMLRAVPNPVVVAATESQRGLVAPLSHLPATARLTWLLGDHAQRLPELQLGTPVVLYRNRWSPADEAAIVKRLRPETFDQVLVTSPSNWQRLRKLQAQLPAAGWQQATYYVLGDTTAAALRADGVSAVKPRTKQDVLAQVIAEMCGH